MISRFHIGGSKPPRPPHAPRLPAEVPKPVLSRRTSSKRDCFRSKGILIENLKAHPCGSEQPKRHEVQNEGRALNQDIFKAMNDNAENMKRAETFGNLKRVFKIHPPLAGTGKTVMRRTISLNDYVTIYQSSNLRNREDCASRDSLRNLQTLGIKGTGKSQAGVIQQDRFKPQSQASSHPFGQIKETPLKKKVGHFTLLGNRNLNLDSIKGSPSRKEKIPDSKMEKKSSFKRLKTPFNRGSSIEKRVASLEGNRKVMKSRSECVSSELQPQCRGIKGGAVNYIKKEKIKAPLLRSTPYFMIDSKEVKKQRNQNQSNNKIKQFVLSLQRNQQLKKADEVINQYRKVMHRLLSEKDFITSKEYLTSHQYLESHTATQDIPIVITKSVFNNRLSTAKPNTLASPKERSPSNQSLLEYDSDQLSIKNSTRPITQITITEQSKCQQPSSFFRQSSAGSLQKREEVRDLFEEYKTNE